jgi:hypothetical protein
MSLLEALKGAGLELAATRGPGARLQRLGRIAGLFAAELGGTLALAPYAARAGW